MIRELDKAEMLEALHDLDGVLGTRKIEIRAVGGFALSWRDIREEGLTADIDTLTDDYPADVQDAIAEVGRKRGLESWWLNNDVAADDAEFLKESMGLSWEEVPCGFSNITLFVADLASLLKLKLSAVEDSELSGRTRDLEDTILILKSMGVSKQEFARKFSYLHDSGEMPHAYRAIARAIW